MIIKTIFLFVMFLTLSVRAQDVKKYFDEYDVKGSFMVYDTYADKYYYYDSARCFTRFTPASTFKIPNSLIGLETGILTDENFVIPWDGTKSRETCDKDLSLKDAIKFSCVWYYKELARRVGSVKMQEMLDAFNYGNKDISNGIDKFWLEGSLKISQAEQIEFLKKLYKYELPVSKRSVDILKNIIVLDSTSGYIMRGKTGWGFEGNTDIGWLVGWIEKSDNIYFYAINVETDKDNPRFAESRRAITENIFREFGVIK
ncbi:MAG: class D beta-lactamase [Ignavibacteria bacterium]|nr:class D beta-lactamase [Ignavibacteria bacterium]